MQTNAEPKKIHKRLNACRRIVYITSIIIILRILIHQSASDISSVEWGILFVAVLLCEVEYRLGWLFK